MPRSLLGSTLHSAGSCSVSFSWTLPNSRADPGASLEGYHPGLFFLERLDKLASSCDPELAVRAREMTLDGLERDVKLVSDLTIRPPLGSKPCDAQLARRQCLDAATKLAPRPRTRRPELVSCPGDERSRAAPGGKVESLGERLPSRGPLSGPAQRSSKLRQRSRELERGRRLSKHAHRFAEQLA